MGRRLATESNNNSGESLSEHVVRLLEEARGMPPGAAREKQLRLARQAKTASQIQRWLSSPGLQAPI